MEERCFRIEWLASVGGYDIHRAVRNEDGSWGAPTPMGVPVNSVEDEMSFVMGAKGEVGTSQAVVVRTAGN